MTNEDVYNIVRQIPIGKVATYGQIARMTGYPRHARHVGFALSRLGQYKQYQDIPWHRVINAQGQVSQRGFDRHDELQRIMLEDEGIIFNTENKISLKKYQWKTE